ncbi:MAG: hypothetical protein KR126chlam2_00402 [Chlamydiae bacterium]|nr:hypothetical protein [Chlamydiota bacterium]
MKPKAAIVYLAPKESMNRFEVFLYSLELMEKHFNQRFGYPVVIFHEDLPEAKMEQIRSTFSSEFYFEKLVDFLELPTHLNIEKVKRWLQGKDGGRLSAQGLGYRQMCRFYSHGLLFHPALHAYDYYWRFDDDSYLTHPVNFDPIETLEKQGCVYGFRSLMREDPKRTEGQGLKEIMTLTRKFARKNRLPLKHLRPFSDWLGRSNGKQYYTNFEINKLSFWRNNTLFKEYISLLEHADGFYKYRWGDALTRTLACSIFLKPQQIHHFTTIGYRHNYHAAVTDSVDIHYFIPDEIDRSASVVQELGAFHIPGDA